MHWKLHQDKFSFIYPIIQGNFPGEPAETPFITLAVGQSAYINVGLRLDTNYYLEGLKLNCFALDGSTLSDNANENSRTLLQNLDLNLNIDAGRGLFQVLSGEVISPAPGGDGMLLIDYQLPARSIITLEVRNNGRVLNAPVRVGGYFIGLADNEVL